MIVPQDSIGVFFTHSPLTSYLISHLSAGARHAVAIAVVSDRCEIHNGGPAYWNMVRTHLVPSAFQQVLDTGSARGRLSLHFLKRRFGLGRPVIVYVSPWNAQGMSYTDKSGYSHRFLIEHGLDETMDVVAEFMGQRTNPKGTFILTLAEEVEKYLISLGMKPNGSFIRPGIRGSEQAGALVVGRSLFALNPVLEDGILPEMEFSKCVDHFLDRRRKTRYILKPHPRRCNQTARLFAEKLNARGLEYEIVAGDEGIIESEFSKYRCAEICGVFSTSVLFIAKWHAVEWDWMVPELLQSQSLRKFERDRFPILGKIFISSTQGAKSRVFRNSDT